MDKSQIVKYYQDPDVRLRLAEYCGFCPPEHPYFSSTYIVGSGKSLLDLGYERSYHCFNNDNFERILDYGLDIFRSKMDQENTLFVFDVKYFNKSSPALVYYNPDYCFLKLEPLYQLICETLFEFGIEFLTLMTEQGYNFVFQVHRSSPQFNSLCKLGELPSSLPEKYDGKNRTGRIVPLDLALAFEGMGRLQEYLCHRIMQRWDFSYLPLYFSDIIPTDSGSGFEGAALDITAFADPLYMRDVRLPFSTHQKGSFVQMVLPRNALHLDFLLSSRRDFLNSSFLARQLSCNIPYSHEGIGILIQEYKESKLFALHQEWDSVEQDPPVYWDRGYLAFDPENLPPCVAQSLEFPHPLLLQPTHLLNLTRALLFEGWHAKHIAGLVRSKYETTEVLKDGWVLYDPSSRADFWIRIFSCLIQDELDNFSDYSCISLQNRGLCPKPWCGINLSRLITG
ncbi:hypothetical protein ACFL35_15630 [Candidatus Riflebacteria bacterium]